MTESGFPRLIFAREFDERAQFEAAAAGYLAYATVQQQDGRSYAVTFYDCTRLAQDLEYEVSAGRMCVADAGMIVLPEVTLENMLTAVRALTNEGYFEHLEPLGETPDAENSP